MNTNKTDITPYCSSPVIAATGNNKRSIGFWAIVRCCVTVVLLLLAAISFCKSHYFNDLIGVMGNEAQKQTGKDPALQYKGPEPMQIDPTQIASQFWKEHHFLIERCSWKDKQAIINAVKDLNILFDQKQENVPGFLDDLFSFKSKGKMAYYFVRGNGRLETFLHEKTEHYLGSSYLLQAEVERITNVLKMEIQKNHNELLLALEADLAALPYSLNIRQLSGKDFKEDFNHSFDIALKGMLPRTVGVTLGAETIALSFDIWVASAIGARIVGAMVTSGIIAGGSTAAGGTAVAGGAALAPWTAGVSIAVGLVVAIAIDLICNKVARADAEDKILTALEDWREASITSFNANAARGINHFNGARLLALKRALKKELSLLSKKGVSR
ncbi:MAG: hypothetical protein JRF40_00505 [Deltaproteobacteria bacterium]|nr:hypothetical protein [Deltaproteobacteria bacterium]